MAKKFFYSFFKEGYTPYKTEMPLQGMGLQEKEVIEETYIKTYIMFSWVSARGVYLNITVF